MYFSLNQRYPISYLLSHPSSMIIKKETNLGLPPHIQSALTTIAQSGLAYQSQKLKIGE